MMKGLPALPQQHASTEENMSNLTSASGEETSSIHHQSSLASPSQPPAKKKRNLPGHPDPDAEVIALSPKTLMATNRFVCEICNKGFQRDQNLQLHRRGHNLPWKLKQRTSQEVRKKVYVCPEPSCVHHNPLRALGDLTGIKKHFCRKHEEKKWKCEKCSKRYAVQSDWKAHSKICGTKEYRCDCGTLFSRRDSFITHRAFCDKLAEESARAITADMSTLTNPLLLSFDNQHPAVSYLGTQSNFQTQFPPFIRDADEVDHHDIEQRDQQEHFNHRSAVPPWLGASDHLDLSSSIYSTRLDNFISEISQPQASPHMSATALLQKAAKMGATVSKPSASSSSMLDHSLHRGHMSLIGNDHTSITTGFGLGLPSHEYIGSGFDLSQSASSASSLLQNMARSSLQHKKEEGSGEHEGLTRDFLGVSAFPHRDILSMAALHPYDHIQSEKPWQA